MAALTTSNLHVTQELDPVVNAAEDVGTVAVEETANAVPLELYGAHVVLRGTSGASTQPSPQKAVPSHLVQ